MPALILIESNSYDKSFFDGIDYYLNKYEFVKISDRPKTYFIRKQIPPSSVHSIVNGIKRFENYNQNVTRIYYSAGLQII